MDDKRRTGQKRIRLIASVAAMVIFGMTAFEQFRGEPPSAALFGIVVSMAMGFGAMFVIMTLILLVLRLFRKDT